eukprot:scaffold75491_cov36-Tisochrysis_lutea.AAC.1
MLLATTFNMGNGDGDFPMQEATMRYPSMSKCGHSSSHIWASGVWCNAKFIGCGCVATRKPQSTRRSRASKSFIRQKHRAVSPYGASTGQASQYGNGWCFNRSWHRENVVVPTITSHGS